MAVSSYRHLSESRGVDKVSPPEYNPEQGDMKIFACACTSFHVRRGEGQRNWIVVGWGAEVGEVAKSDIENPANGHQGLSAFKWVDVAEAVVKMQINN